MADLSLWRPFHELERWRREMDREFNRHFANLFREAEPEGLATAYLPAIESYVKNGNLVVRADVPGLDAKDIELTVLGNVLTMKGERKQQQEIKKEEYIRRETSYGSFERRVTLPEGTDAERIKASFKNGVVEITMPVTKELAAKKIPLESASETSTPAVG
ncbi:MAG TPA: Hsp20/alpha crystallin family protein [Candidatus Binataceae bacterium]|nr:Hsp20/alpha crystallin family protein [Candidatus Binataceae bacterium]